MKSIKFRALTNEDDVTLAKLGDLQQDLCFECGHCGAAMPTSQGQDQCVVYVDLRCPSCQKWNELP